MGILALLTYLYEIPAGACLGHLILQTSCLILQISNAINELQCGLPLQLALLICPLAYRPQRKLLLAIWDERKLCCTNVGLGVENGDKHDVMSTCFKPSRQRGHWIEVAWYATT